MSSLYAQPLSWLSNHRLRLWPFSPTREASRPISEEDVRRQHLVFHRAYVYFAQRHPQWVQRRFDDDFLRRLMARRSFPPSAALPTGAQLAASWDRQFGILSTTSNRAWQMAELAQAANDFLYRYTIEWGQCWRDELGSTPGATLTK
ncbi:MAG: hypothetical protein KJZ93_29955 [Caldilineaceae bacterium]|nr:hypothetical protein [Caldilineaceae bacterium]